MPRIASSLASQSDHDTVHCACPICLVFVNDTASAYVVNVAGLAMI